MHSNHVMRVEGRPDLVKQDGAILNTDKKQYEAALARQKMGRDRAKLEQRVATLEKQFEEFRRFIMEGR